MPRNSRTANMNSSMVNLGNSKAVTQSTMPELAPENAIIWLKVEEARRIMKTIVVTTSVPSTDFRITLQDIQRNAVASTITPRTPNAAASDGVAMPIRIRPMTQKNTNPSGRMLITVSRIFLPKPIASTEYCGAASGSNLTWTKISTA